MLASTEIGGIHIPPFYIQNVSDGLHSDVCPETEHGLKLRYDPGGSASLTAAIAFSRLEASIAL
jgi:hypothetical protein